MPSRRRLRDRHIAFIGGGAMAEAMVRALVKSTPLTAGSFTVSAPRSERRAELTELLGVRAIEANAVAASAADIVILSVKPQSLPEVARELAGTLRPAQLVLSIVAGVPLRSLEESLRHSAIVRSMPNTPGQIGHGITVWCATPATTAEQRTWTIAILGALGELVEVDHERLIDMATAISGSGPAYVFRYMEALIDGAVAIGLPHHLAERLVRETVEGSAHYARVSGRDLPTMRAEVTSPGGTTAAAMGELDEGSLEGLVEKAIAAAYARARELGEEAARGIRTTP